MLHSHANIGRHTLLVISGKSGKAKVRKARIYNVRKTYVILNKNKLELPYSNVYLQKYDPDCAC